MRGTRLRLAAIAILGVAALSPAAANAAERVTDGGFENNDPAWTHGGTTVCTTALCPGESAAAGARWLGLGGGFAMFMNENKVVQSSQTVTITPPATLTLMLRITPGDATIRRFTVYLDDDNKLVTQVDHAVTGGYATYTPVTVSLDAYPGTHTLKLHGQSFVPFMNGIHARFQVDDVSIQDSFVPPTEPPTDPPTDPTDPTDPPPDPPAPTCRGRAATIVGTDEAELLDGTPKADVIVALGGNDVVRAGAGDDIVCAGMGDDEVKGSAGKDRLYGEEGRDKLNGGGGLGDRCVGGPSRDKASRSCEKSKTL